LTSQAYPFRVLLLLSLSLYASLPLFNAARIRPADGGGKQGLQHDQPSRAFIPSAFSSFFSNHLLSLIALIPPLEQEKDGSNFPAKLYGTSATVSALTPVATLVAGETFSWELKGTATHNGGSCQVGISYDYLETMAVMASWIGGCPLEQCVCSTPFYFSRGS
jgi:hypothetical protein